MQYRTLLCFLFIATCEGVSVRARIADQDRERNQLSESAAFGGLIAEAEAEYHKFWTEALAAQEAELLKLQATLDKNTSALKNTTAMPMKEEAKKSVPSAPAQAKSSEEHEHRKSPLAGLKLNLNPKSKLDLIPALAMLKSLYEDGKARIAKLNAREKVSKTRFESQSDRHKKRLDNIAAKVGSHKLSAEFGHNETVEEERQFKYWKGCREREHRQFHTSLKIQHGTMAKEKEMIDMYEKTIAGTADETKIKKELGAASGGGMPEIVFVQEETVEFCRSALAEVRAARADLKVAGVSDRK